MSVPPFQLTGRAGRLHGRGACDTKGPTAALLAAFERWTRLPARSRGAVRWIIAATAGEEQGSLGAQALVRAGFRADFVVALEPTGLRVVSAAKGVLRVWIEASGRAAHGSRPDRGINAVERLLPFAMAVRSEITPELAARRHALLGRATVNLGVLQGGGELNIVPDKCRLGLDIRTHPTCPEDDALALVERIRKKHAPESTLTVHRRAPAFVTSRKDQWSAQLRRCGRGWDKADWFCDANIFAAHGIPAVAFGPGDIAQAHTHNEYIETVELKAGARAFFEFLTSKRQGSM
jgi:acetylornithine deacetylase/succinyl-diaminopimelate desuccinylase-like protein